MPEIGVPEPLEPLSPSENTKLGHLEHIIENFRKSYYKAGAALAEIRDSRLYRATHASFEAYVAERWELSRPRAYELIDASRVANNLSAVADITTTNESQLRAPQRPASRRSNRSLHKSRRTRRRGQGNERPPRRNEGGTPGVEADPETLQETSTKIGAQPRRHEASAQSYRDHAGKTISRDGRKGSLYPKPTRCRQTLEAE